MEFNMRKNDRFIAIFIGLGIWTLIVVQFLEPKSVTAQNEPHTHEPHTHEEHKHRNFSLLDHVHSSSDISSLRKDMRRLIESCVVIEESISC
jgi:hypothetical protein|tara:strand:- start:275 stop:550 length:276 start_codon:yes stop_codon:yes gene_type:complete